MLNVIHSNSNVSILLAVRVLRDGLESFPMILSQNFHLGAASSIYQNIPNPTYAQLSYCMSLKARCSQSVGTDRILTGTYRRDINRHMSHESHHMIIYPDAPMSVYHYDGCG
jgi:hypothetical protein